SLIKSEGEYRWLSAIGKTARKIELQQKERAVGFVQKQVPDKRYISTKTSLTLTLSRPTGEGRARPVSPGARREHAQAAGLRQTRIRDAVGQFVSDQRQQTDACGGRRHRTWTFVRAVHGNCELHGRDLAANLAVAVHLRVNVGVTSAASDRGDLVGCQGRQIN